jgi:rubredoxin
MTEANLSRMGFDWSGTLQIKKRRMIMKYVCDVCGWEYDEEKGYPEGGIAPGTKWENVPEDFECPLCFVGKDQFSEA